MQSTGKHRGRAKTVGRSVVLLIAIGVLVTLATIYISGLLPPQVRAVIAVSNAEMRLLAVSLETYFSDHDKYPPAVDEDGNIVPYTKDGSNVSTGNLPFLLTTPMNYSGSLPRDSFNRGKDGIRKRYRYATDGVSCWIMSSYGPDRDPDIAIEDFPSQKGAAGDIKKFLSHGGVGKAVLYDSTNGTTSSGDMIKTGVREESNPPSRS